MSTPVVSIALLGVGRIGVGHAHALASCDNVALTICDVSVERAAQVAREISPASGIPVAVMGLDELFDNTKNIDGLVIATPTSTHADLILRAAQAGVPFFCEKPVAPDLEGTRRCLEEVSRAGVAHHIGFQRRVDPAYVEAKRRLEAGELGEVHRIHVLTCDPKPPSEDFVAHSGGIWRDCLIHDIDAIRWVTGREIVEVMAMGQVRGESYFSAYDDIDEGVAIMRLDDGTLATAHTSRNNGHGYDVRMELAGTKATCAVGLEAKMPLESCEPGVAFPDQEPWNDFIARFEHCYATELKAFVDIVCGRGQSLCTIDDALESLYVALALDRSRQEGRVVTIAEIRAQ